MDRLALVKVKSVLVATAIHRLMVLSLNKKVLKQVEKIIRGLLWVSKDGHCLVQGMPPMHGRLDIPDLARTAISLQVWWLWRMRTDLL